MICIFLKFYYLKNLVFIVLLCTDVFYLYLCLSTSDCFCSLLRSPTGFYVGGTGCSEISLGHFLSNHLQENILLSNGKQPLQQDEFVRPNSCRIFVGFYEHILSQSNHGCTMEIMYKGGIFHFNLLMCTASMYHSASV
jgi:hypothetical protein